MEWVHDLEFGLFVGQWEIGCRCRDAKWKRAHFKPCFDVRERGTRARQMPSDATRERVALQGRFPATAEVKEVMTGKTACFILLGLLFHESALAPAAPETVRAGIAAGERGGPVQLPPYAP
jgi:hypothetical protein